MAETLPSGARIFLQGDVPEAVRWMRDMCEAHGNGCFDLAPECRNQADLMRDEWETITSGEKEAGPDSDIDEVEAGEEIQGAKQSEDVQLPLAWSSDTSAGWLPHNPL